MATFIVTGVPKVLAEDFSHRHIEGLCTDDRAYHPVREVIASIGAGHTWKTKAGGYEATITVVSGCFEPGCTAAPYVGTNHRSLKKDNLEKLDLC
jgi:hypothetical protein